MEFTCMRKAAVGEPEFFIEVFGVHDQRIAFPVSQRAAVEGREVFIVRLQRSAVGVNQSPVVIAAADEAEDSLFLSGFQELNSVWKLKLSRASRRHAREKHWIALQKTALPQFIKVSRPTLEWGDLIDIRQIAQETIAIHLNV